MNNIYDLTLRSMVHDVDICDDEGIILTFHHTNNDYNVITFKRNIIGIDEI